MSKWYIIIIFVIEQKSLVSNFAIFFNYCIKLLKNCKKYHLFRYSPEILGTKVWGRGARFQIIFSG